MKQFDQIFRQQAERAFSTYNADHLAGEGWESFVRKQKGEKRFAIIIPFWAKAASVAVLVSLGSLFIYQKVQVDPPADFAAQVQTVSKPDNENRIPLASPQVRPEDHPLSEKSVIDNTPLKLPAKKVAVAEAVIIKDKEEISEAVSSGLDSVAPVNETANEGYFAEDNTDAVVKKDISVPGMEDETPSGKKTSIIAGLSGMMSGFEDMMSKAPGVSVGFYLERKLTRRLSVRPGLALAKSSYGSTGQSSDKVFMNSVTSAGSITGSVGSYENQLDIVTVEVPVNMVYTVFERAKSSIFISAGVSTMVYLEQNLNSSFTNIYSEQKVDLASGNLYLETRSQDINVESDEKAFSHVDYFGLTNLSAGYSMPFKKGGAMLIEPFVQLPLSDLTSFDVRIRYGGMSFKFRFGQ